MIGINSMIFVAINAILIMYLLIIMIIIINVIILIMDINVYLIYFMRKLKEK